MTKKINKKFIWIGVAIVVVIIIGLIVIPGSKNVSSDIAICEQGTFETAVSTVGQIEATQSIDITIPDALRDRRTRIWAIKIADLVAEGTKVKKGEFVASLDPTDVDNELKEVQDNLDQYQNSYESACLDSSLKLSGYRDAILSARDQLADKEIKVEQSKYESKAYQRQAQIEYERALREVDQKKRDLTSQKIKLKVGIQRIEDDIKYNQLRFDKLKELKAGLKIVAPADGMVIYGKNRWRGDRKFQIGDEVNRHNPNIAELPDLKSLVSEAFVQEVDIKNVELGQKVRINIDAFPEKTFTGKISKLANIGQQIPGKKINGFKVTITLNPYEEEIYPGMTTNNQIITGVWEDALMIPRPALFLKDSIRFVYHKTGLTIEKQEVITGGENELQFRIVKGLSNGDKVLLVAPDNADELTIKRL